jgi:DNA-directed RNA polymerase subunit RPC12/RpoP
MSSLWYRLFQNINEDYLEVFLITSQAGGREPSEGRQFGVGKSTLGIWITYRAHAFDAGTVYVEGGQLIDVNDEDGRVKLMKHIIDNYVVWTLSDLLKVVLEASAGRRIPAVMWDDVQLDCPAWQHIPKEKREAIERISVLRPLVANIVMTAPAISEIAKPLRKYVTWEVIVPRRGVYEIQFIAKKRDFYNPTEDRARLWYDATGTFTPLPEEVMQHYRKRREEAARKHSKETLQPNTENRAEKEGTHMKCTNCGHEWTYTGKTRSGYITCPRCFHKIKILEEPAAQHT